MNDSVQIQLEADEEQFEIRELTEDELELVGGATGKPGKVIHTNK